MAGLPHFKNSTAGPGKYEPIYLNQFEVIVTPPPSIAGYVGFGNNLMLEHVLKVSNLPEYAGSGSAVAIQNYKFSNRAYAPARPQQTYHQFTIEFEVNLNNGNDMYTYNALRAWANLVYDPLTGQQGLKVDYADASIQVTHFNRAGLIFREFIFSPVFIGPAKFTETALDYTSEAIYRLIVQFTADTYKETRIGQ